MKRFGSFFSEGSIPGKKRGPYQNTKAMTKKMSADDINKAGTETLKKWKERGGVNKSAVSAELSDRETDTGDDSGGDDSSVGSDNEISLDKESKKSRESVLDKKNDIMDMMDVPEDDRQETEVTTDTSKEEKIKAQEEKYRKTKEKWEKKKEKFFAVIDPESALGKAVGAFFEADPAPFPGMGDEAETVFELIDDLEKFRAGSIASKYGRKETKAAEKAEKAAKEAQEKAEKERKEREEREEKRKKKTQKEEYKSLRTCMTEVWMRT